MRHEKIQLDAAGRKPIRSSAAEHGFLRHDLCSYAARKRRLACGHTTARNHLRVLMSELKPLLREDDREEWDRLSAALSQIDAAIGELDHRKGFAELALARALARESSKGSERVVECEGGAAERVEIQRLESVHANDVEELSCIKERAIQIIHANLQRHDHDAADPNPPRPRGG